jgi:large subunit ribosomal protein L23
MKDARQILIRPILTEKSVTMTTLRKYTFEVHPSANKVEIRQAVESLFAGTDVAEVNTMMVQGKLRRMGGYRRRARRAEGHTSRWKKAIVTLRAGTIPAFEGL